MSPSIKSNAGTIMPQGASPYRQLKNVAKAFLLLSAATLSANAANLLSNGGFETQSHFSGGAAIAGDGSYIGVIAGQLPGWTIEAGHAVTIHNIGAYPLISGTYSVNIDGEGYNGRNANFYQDFLSAVGSSYLLEFDWSTWRPGSNIGLDVTVTDTVTSSLLYRFNYTGNGTFGVTHQAASFLGSGNSLRLRVQESPNSGTNDNRFMVDNFSVVQTTVPDASSTLGLALVAVGGLVLAGRRSRN